MDHIMYKGYEISVNLIPLETGEWNTTIWITKDTEKGRKEKSFSGPDTFKAEEKAIQYCIAFGKKIIDGEIPDFSVNIYQ